MNSHSPWKMEFIRRLIDVTCSAVGLVLLSPVLVAVGLVILVNDRPPVFFRQTRVGRNGKPFRIVKFRTMRNGTPGAMITTSGDERITKTGARLRRYKLDELPQLFNVLVGDMSLVGPRPEVPEYVELDAPLWQTVLRARPGITDLATLLYRNEESMLSDSADPNVLYRENILPAKLALNVGYLWSRSIGRDLKLVLLTIYYSAFPTRFSPKLIQNTFKPGIINV